MMKTVRQILDEVIRIGNSEHLIKRLPDQQSWIRRQAGLLLHRKIGATPSGHDIYRRNLLGRANYTAVDPKTRQMQMSVSGKERNGSLDVWSTRGRKGSTIKAADMYSHLLNDRRRNQLNRINSDSYQTDAGARIWDRLRQSNNVNITKRTSDGRAQPATDTRPDGTTSYYQASRKPSV